MDKNTAAWVSIILVIAAVVLAVMRYYYAAWAMIAVNVVLLGLAVRKK